jgi:hypothetical protein
MHIRRVLVCTQVGADPSVLEELSGLAALKRTVDADESAWSDEIDEDA